MLILYMLSYVSACPYWKCENLDKDICAEWNEREVKINTQACSEGKNCYLMGLELERNWNKQGVYWCEDFQLSFKTQPINCNTGKTSVAYLKNHPITCKKDKDCKMMNEKSKECVCSMDGQSYCEVAEGDFELELYRDSCYELNQYQAFAWYLYIDFFPMLHKVPLCAQLLFEDIKFLKKFRKEVGLNYTEAFHT